MKIESSILIPLVFMFGISFGHDKESTHSEPKDVIQTNAKYYTGCDTFKSKDQILIYSPNGLRVTQNSEHLLGFGIKVYIITKNKKYATYWLNTTEVDPISNNFTLYEPTTKICEGDILDYSIQKRFKNGSTHWYECKQFRVNGSLIKDSSEAPIFSDNPHVDDQKHIESQTFPPKNSTLNDNSSKTNTFVLAENADVTTESALKEFIISRLTELLPAVNWNNTITEVFRWNSKFSFDVKTPEEKRKILRLLEKNKNAAEVVLDFDNLETLDNNDDYDYNEEE